MIRCFAENVLLFWVHYGKYVYMYYRIHIDSITFCANIICNTYIIKHIIWNGYNTSDIITSNHFIQIMRNSCEDFFLSN